MNLPNYFLADLPPGARLTPAMLNEACATLKRNRATYLQSRSTAQLITLLAGVASEWLDAAFPLRKLALAQGPAALGFSSQTLEQGLSAFFRQVTPDGLESLLEQDLGSPARLEKWVASAAEARQGESSLAVPPAFYVQIAAGNIPVAALHGMVLGVLMGSAQFTKCATGTSLVPRLFAHSLYQADPKLGACIEVAEWPRGDAALESALFLHADCVCATGKDETVRALRERVPGGVRFFGYGHRVSFGYVAAEMLSGPQLRETVAGAAADVTAWDQLGCLSPQVIYAESSGVISPEKFAELLAQELEARERVQPRGPLPVEEAATIASRRSFYEVRAAHSRETRLWQSRDSTAWTVVFEAAPLFQPSCLNRFVYVKSVKDPKQALHAADAIHDHVSTIGLAAPPERWPGIAEEMARWGASRICPLGRMQEPPVTWRHDGRPALGDLVRWVDCETK